MSYTHDQRQLVALPRSTLIAEAIEASRAIDASQGQRPSHWRGSTKTEIVTFVVKVRKALGRYDG